MEPAIQENGRLDGLVNAFFVAIGNDARISPAHISLYMALVHIWSVRCFAYPIYIYSSDLMPVAKIYGTATYHRCIRELNKYGYIKYVPSHNHILGSLVYLLQMKAEQK